MAAIGLRGKYKNCGKKKKRRKEQDNERKKNKNIERNTISNFFVNETEMVRGKRRRKGGRKKEEVVGQTGSQPERTGARPGGSFGQTRAQSGTAREHVRAVGTRCEFWDS